MPETFPVKAPDPQEEFLRIRKLFHEHGGELVTREDRTVTWKDTRLFRMYEFKYHTVIVFPYNWREKTWWRGPQFDLIIFAGHVQPGVNAFNAVDVWPTNFNPWKETELRLGVPGGTYMMGGIDWHLAEPALQDVSFEGFHLGEDREVMLRREEQRIRMLRKDDDESMVNYEIGMLRVTPDTSLSYTTSGMVHAFFKDEKVARMEFTQTGGPMLAGFALDEPVTPVVAEGTFAIPEQTSN